MSTANSRLALFLALAICCAALAEKPPKPFTVDQFLMIAMEYDGTHSIVGVDTYGPSEKEFLCQRGAAAAVSQAQGKLARNHTLVTSCLQVEFGGPLPKGAVAIVPAGFTPIEYVTVAIEYTSSGDFLGAKALHAAPDAKTCHREARDVLDTNYKSGKVPSGNSMILYCVPAPSIKRNASYEGSIV